MSSNLDPLGVRRSLGRDRFAPPQEHGPDGWLYVAHDRQTSVIVSAAWHDDDSAEWVHASIAHPDADPTYAELCELHAAVFGDGFAVQMFVPQAEHVNIHHHALHLWGRLDGSRFVPINTAWGTI